MLVGNVGDEQPHQSLFSLLLDIETRLRAEARGDSHHPSRFAKTRRTQKEQESLPVKLNSLTRFNLRLDEGAFAQDGMVEDLADVAEGTLIDINKATNPLDSWTRYVPPTDQRRDSKAELAR